VFTFGVRFGSGTDAASFKTNYYMFRFLDTPTGCS
jgi:hypothetical protein